MILSEAAHLLSTIASFNNRTIGESDVIAWQSVLADVPLADAEEAVRRHYAEHIEWMMPAHVRRLVRDIERDRASAASLWAPGQWQVPKEQAVPELPRGERLTAADLSPKVVDLLSQLRAELPDVPRERLFPREAHWDRQQRAFRRQDAAEPNPRYRPGGPTGPLVVRIEQLAVSYRERCRAAGPHDDGLHIDECPDSDMVPPPADCDDPNPHGGHRWPLHKAPEGTDLWRWCSGADALS